MSGNILLADEMVHMFGRMKIHKSCCLRLDLRNIFDAVKSQVESHNILPRGYVLRRYLSGSESPLNSIFAYGELIGDI